MRTPVRLLALVGALAACAQAAGEPGEPQHLAAPTPAGVITRITEADDGKTVSVPVGGPFAVELVSIPTAGYTWAPVAQPRFIETVESLSGPIHRDQLKPGFAGGNHWQVLVFQAKSAGEGVLTLEERRPWETGEPPAKTFAVTIQAR